MKRQLIKITVIVLIAGLVVIGGISLYNNHRSQGVTGAIEFGKNYQLNELRESTYFEGAVMDRHGYFKINEDRKTGELYLVGLTSGKLDLIVTKYAEGPISTTIDFEFIYKETLHKLTATSTNDEIRIKMVLPHQVSVTQENPDYDLRELKYSATLLVFVREVK